MTTVGAIDIGTNTVLLLVAEGPADSPKAVLERATITRLGQDVDRTGRLAADAMERTVACLAGYVELLHHHGVSRTQIVCTSAARDAENGAEFLDRATAVLGTAPRIIGGDEEARLVFDGALTGLHVPDSVTVFDVGGGSTEIVHGSPGSPHVTASIDVGSVRLTERHVRSDPPRTADLDAIQADVRKALDALPRRPTTCLVGVAGTITTLAAIDQGLSTYDPARVHGSTLELAVVARLARELASIPLDARRRVTGLEPGRADVIVAGALIVLTVLEWHGASSLIVSDRGVRWGLARAALRT